MTGKASGGWNPLWLHPVVGGAWIVLAGMWVSFAGYPWQWVLAVAAVLPAAAGAAGAAMGRRVGRGALFAAVAGAVAGGWLVYAAVTDVLRPVDLPAVGVLAVPLLLLAVWYSDLRRSLPAPPPGPVPSREQVIARELSPTITTTEAADFAGILRDGGLGSVRVVGWDNTWAGFRATVELDEALGHTYRAVVDRLVTITGRAARVYAARGQAIPDGAVRVRRGDAAHVVVFDVRLRDVLAETIAPVPDTGVRSVNDGLVVGRWEDGEPIALDVRQTHGLTAGSTGSGKSTWENSVLRELVRCDDVLPWMGGLAKLYDLACPWLEPLSDGRATRPVLDFVAGQDWDEVARMLRALWTVAYVRQEAPRATFRRQRNVLVPGPDQPLLYSVWEESDMLLRSQERIEMPVGPALTPSQIFLYVTSKGRSSQVLVDLLNQGVTEQQMGPLAGAIKANIHRRTALYTTLKTHGAWILNHAPVDTSLLRGNAMYLRTGPDSPVLPGKAAYHSEETGIPAVAVAMQDRGTVLEDYTQAKLIELLGDDYAGRWNRERTQVWRDQFGSFPSLEDATPPAVRESVTAGRPARTPAAAPPPGGGGTPRVPGTKDGKPGWWIGAFFVPDLAGKLSRTDTTPPAGGAAQGGGPGVPAEWAGTLAELEALPVADPVRPARGRVDPILAALLAAFPDPADWVPIGDIAVAVGGDTATVGIALTRLGVPVVKRPGGDRGRSMRRVREVAAAQRRGDGVPPAGTAGGE